MFNIRNLVSRISQVKDGESGDNSQSRSSPGKGRSSSQGNTSATEEVAVEAEGFLCPTCMAAFPSAEDLQIHYERMHLEPGANYLCPMCKARLESSTALELHFAANHATSVVCSKNVDDLNQELSQLTQTLNAERWVSEELRKEINQFREMSRSYGTSEESKMFQMQLDGLHETKSLLSSEVVLLRKQLAEALDSMVLLRQERDHLQEKALGYSQALVKLQAELDEKFGDRTYFQDHISLPESKPIDNSDDANILKRELSSMHTIMDQKTADWKAERTRLEQNLEDMESRHKRLTREYEVLKDSFDSEQQSLSNLQRIRDETDICVSQLRQEVTSLQEMLNHARDRAEGEVSAKEDELLKAKMQLLTNQQQVSQLEDKCEALEKSVIAAQMEVLTKDKLFQDQARLEADRYEKQRARLEEMIQRLEREKIHLATKSEQGEGYQGLVDQLQEDNERLASELRNSQKALQDNEDLLLQKEAEISSIQLAVASGKDKLQQMESRANTADQQLEQSRMVYDELEVKYTQLQQQISILQKNCAVTEEQCRNKDRELSQANEDHKLQTERFIKESVDLQDTICQLEQKVALMRGHCADLENKCSNASQQVIEAENNHRLDIERLGQDISDLRSQNASFACQVEELLQHSESLRKENQSVCDRDQITSNELRTVRENLDRERQVTQQLQDSMSVLERLVCTQKADKQDLEKEKSLLMENIQLLSGEKESLSTLASHMKQQLDECREEHRIHLQRINTEMDSLNKEKQFMVDALCKEKDERKTDMMVAENAQAKLNEQLKVSNNNMTKVREELETQYIRCQEFQLQIDKYHAEQLERDASLSLLNDEKQQLQQHCSQWQNEVERLKMSSAELRRRLEDSQAALHELGRENQSLQMENAKLHGRKWADDSEVYDCHGCQRDFTLTVRKHHCRNCGQIFCGDCSNKNASLGSNRKAVRVCEACFKELCSPR